MKTLLTFLISTLSLYAYADNRLYLNGELSEGKQVVELTFSGDNVTFVYSDGTSETYDMGTSTINIEFETISTSIDVPITKMHTIIGNTLTINGLQSGDRVEIFNMQGKKVKATNANADELTINISSLNNGIYLLRAANYVVKFRKK